MKKKMQVALVHCGMNRIENPYLPDFMYMGPPGLHYVGSSIKLKGHDALYIDMVDANINESDVIRKLHESRPDAVLFYQCCNNRNIIKRICDSLPDGTIRGVGSPDPTFHSALMDDEVFKESYRHVNFVWQGECESGFVDFLEGVDKRSEPVRFNNLCNRIVDLDTLPVLDHNDYINESAFLVTSRGCLPHGCDFCSTPGFYPTGHRSRSDWHIKKELDLIKSSGRWNVYIFDDNFLGFTEVDIKKSLSIIEYAGLIGLKLNIMTTTGQLLKARELNTLERFSGVVVRVFIGVEHCDPSALIKLGKKTDVSDHGELSRKIVRALHDKGISVYLGYINFMPESTLEELEHTATFLHEMDHEASTFHYLSNKLMLFEGTKLFNKYSDAEFQVNYNGREYEYRFSDRRVEYLHGICSYVSECATVLDFLNYEASYLIYLNAFNSTDKGIEFERLKKKLSDRNYEFFMNGIKYARNEISGSTMLDLVAKFRRESVMQIQEFRGFILRLSALCSHILNEPLVQARALKV